MIKINNINSNILTIIKSNSAHIFVDTSNSILNLEILDQKFNKEEFNNLCSGLTEFFLQAYKHNLKYFLIFDVRKIGIYPLSCYEEIKKTLEALKSVLPNVLHSTCIITEPSVSSHILTFFFKIYKPVRPAKIITSKDEIKPFFEENTLF